MVLCTWITAEGPGVRIRVRLMNIMLALVEIEWLSKSFG